MINWDCERDHRAITQADGKLPVYRNWFQDYDRARITKELTDGGFTDQSVWDDLRWWWIGRFLAVWNHWLSVISTTYSQGL